MRTRSPFSSWVSVKAELSEQLESIDANLSVSAGVSSSEASVSGSCLTENVAALFDLFADVLRYPSFPEEELAR